MLKPFGGVTKYDLGRTLGESGRSASAGPVGPAPADAPSPPSKAEGHQFRGEAEEAEGPSAFLVAFLLLCFLSSHLFRIAEKCVLFEAGIMAEGENMETRQK